MRFSNLLPLALTAHSLLIPPTVEVTESNLPITASKQHIELDCPQCPVIADFQESINKVSAWMAGKELNSKIIMDLAVVEDTVTLNGEQLWPVRPNTVFSAKQVTEKGNNYKKPLPLSTSVETQSPEIILGHDGSLTMHTILVDVLGLVDKAVHVQTVKIRVADINGKIALLPTEVSASPAMDSCTTVLCRVKTKIAQKIAALRASAASRLARLRGSCAKKAGHRKGPHVVGGANKFTGTLGRPEIKIHRHSGWRHSFHKTLRSILMPMVWGIITGSVLGAFYGLVLAAIVRARAARRGNYVAVEAASDEEARISLDGPPKYEDVYKAPEEESTDEKKGLLQQQ